MMQDAVFNTVDAAARDLIKAEFASFYTQLVSGTPIDEAAAHTAKGLALIKLAHARMRGEALKVFA